MIDSRRPRRNRLAACALLAACGGGSNDHPDAPIDTLPDAPLPSFGAAMPQVQKNEDAVIAHPKIMIISYALDGSNGSACEDTATELAASPAWGTQTSQYGVVDLTAARPQQIAGPLPSTLTDEELQVMLGSNLGSGSAAMWGPADPSTIYEFVIPSATAYSAGAT